MKTALISGSTKGIGAACARALAADGYRVIINGRSHTSEGQTLADELGGIFIRADVSSPEETREMFSVCPDIDVLVCCAGIADTRLITDFTYDDWRRIFAVNVDGVFNCCSEALPRMIREHKGSIITISSIWGMVGASCECAYSASKAAVIGYTKALAKEVGPCNIRVNCIAPGVIDTDMNSNLSREDIEALKDETPLGTIGSPDDIASLVSFLASDKASFITGQVISPNGGFVI